GWWLGGRQEEGRVKRRIEAQFVAAVKDPQMAPAVRTFAARSLGEIGPAARGALPGLIEAMDDDKQTQVRTEVVWAIGEIGSGDPLLIAELRKIRERDEQPLVRDAIDKAAERLKKKPHGSSITLYVVGGLLTIVAGA